MSEKGRPLDQSEYKWENILPADQDRYTKLGVTHELAVEDYFKKGKEILIDFRKSRRGRYDRSSLEDPSEDFGTDRTTGGTRRGFKGY